MKYYGIDSLSNEVGKVYEHHYNRLDLNGLLLDELNFFKLPDINSGPRYLSEKVKQQNLDKIFSPEYYHDHKVVINGNPTPLIGGSCLGDKSNPQCIVAVMS